MDPAMYVVSIGQRRKRESKEEEIETPKGKDSAAPDAVCGRVGRGRRREAWEAKRARTATVVRYCGKCTRTRWRWR